MVEDSCYICGRNQKDLVPFFGDKIKVIEDELKPFADIDKKVKNYEKKLKEFLKKSEDKSYWEISPYPNNFGYIPSINKKLPEIEQLRLMEIISGHRIWDLREGVKKLLSIYPVDGSYSFSQSEASLVKYFIDLGLITEGANWESSQGPEADILYKNYELVENRYIAYVNLLNLKKKMELKQIELDFDLFLHDARHTQKDGMLEKLGHFTSDIHNEKFVSESNIKVKICPICQSILPYGENSYEDDDPYDDDDRGRDYEGPEVVEYFDDANE